MKNNISYGMHRGDLVPIRGRNNQSGSCWKHPSISHHWTKQKAAEHLLQDDRRSRIISNPLRVG